MGPYEGEHENEETYVRQDEQQREGDRDVARNQTGQGQAGAGLALLIWCLAMCPVMTATRPPRHQLPITVEAPNERLTIAHGLYGRDGWAA